MINVKQGANNRLNARNSFLRIILGSLLLVVMLPSQAESVLTLKQAVSVAVSDDPWVTGSYQRQHAMIAKSVAAGELPDPVVSVGLANVPVDEFKLNQEPMTQIQVGISQQFPRGNSLALKQQQFHELSEQQLYLRNDRLAKVELTVSQLWLETYRYQETIRLIEKDKSLFEYLVDVAEVGYRSALGKSRQQDIIRAQVELTRLEDRLTLLKQQYDVAKATLNEWLVSSVSDDYVIADELPTLTLNNNQPVTRVNDDIEREPLSLRLQQHPMIQSIGQKIRASEVNVQLAKQKYKPQWGLNTSYGYRDDDPNGASRSDFLSIGLSFDLPLFTANRQDKDVEAAIGDEKALKTDRMLALRALQARYQEANQQLLWLEQRLNLYDSRLLQEMHEQAEVSLNAYTNDTGDFSEVVRARIAELNTNIDFLNIKVDRLKTIAQLNYFFPVDRVQETAEVVRP